MRLSSAMAVFALASASTAAADAALSVSPAVVEVSPDRPWADVSIRNESGATVELRAEAFGWEQDDAGRVSLTRVRDVSVFPASARIAPHDPRTFRISVLRAPGERERAYRLALDVRHAEEGADAVVTRALVPVFVEPARRSVRAEIDIVPAAGSRCTVVLRNLGTVRIRPPRVSVAVSARDGAVAERAFDGWWVLAGGARAFDVELPMEADAVREVVARARIVDELADVRVSGYSREMHEGERE